MPREKKNKPKRSDLNVLRTRYPDRNAHSDPLSYTAISVKSLGDTPKTVAVS